MHKRIILAIIALLFIGITHTSAQEIVGRNWDLQELLQLAAIDIDDYWAGVFADNGIRHVTPEIMLFRNRTVSTRCGVAPSYIGPFYCPADDTIYLPYFFMQAQLQKIGDFAPVLILAHEWGHAIQQRADTLDSEYTIDAELQADCFAGAYARHAANDSRYVTLDEGDIDEGATALFYAGDVDIAWFDPRAHGTGKQRMDSYALGLESGYVACLPDGEK